MNMDYETQNTISALRTHLYAGYLVIWFNNQNLVLKFRKMCNLGSIAPFFSKAEIKFLGNLFKRRRQLHCQAGKKCTIFPINRVLWCDNELLSLSIFFISVLIYLRYYYLELSIAMHSNIVTFSPFVLYFKVDNKESN